MSHSHAVTDVSLMLRRGQHLHEGGELRRHARLLPRHIIAPICLAPLPRQVKTKHQHPAPSGSRPTRHPRRRRRRRRRILRARPGGRTLNRLRERVGWRARLRPPRRAPRCWRRRRRRRRRRGQACDDKVGAAGRPRGRRRRGKVREIADVGASPSQAQLLYRVSGFSVRV